MKVAAANANIKAAILATLPIRGDEDPFVVAIGGFYRRWFNLIDDMQLLIDTVAKIKSTEDEDWVPVWSTVGAEYEKKGDALLARKDHADARQAYIQAKTYFSLARFPSPYWSGSSICPPDMSPLKAQSYEDYLRCFRKSTALLPDPPEVITVKKNGMKATGYLRLPKGASKSNKVPAVLVMCGADMLKEDREKYAEGALSQGMAALVVDAPGTGETTFPHAPESIVAWQAAINVLAARPEIDGQRIGAFGVSRGGLWVIRLAAHDTRIKGLIACAPGGAGYWGTPEERAEWRAAAYERTKTNWFGPRGTRPPLKEITEEEQRKDFLRWSLKDQGLLDKLTMPMYLVNGKIDHLTPIGNLYMLLESGPADGRVARVYPDDGHIAARSERFWGPAAWAWLRGVLTKGMKPKATLKKAAKKKPVKKKVAVKKPAKKRQ
ncbi:MAG: alpha/beta hydrolase [Burkholderiales bacterium]|nr:alpha/beta hydrolase [Burkholderiales bacterium]